MVSHPGARYCFNMKTLTALVTSLMMLVGVFISPSPAAAAGKKCCAAVECCCVQSVPVSSAPLTPAPVSRTPTSDQTQLLPLVADFFVLRPAVENPPVSAPLSPASATATPLYQRNCSYLL